MALSLIKRANKKLKTYLPPRGRQICETCKHSGKTCASYAGKCSNGMWQSRDN